MNGRGEMVLVSAPGFHGRLWLGQKLGQAAETPRNLTSCPGPAEAARHGIALAIGVAWSI